MLSPMMTVVLLVVLWLIVVVPMLIKRKDDRAGERSVARFGGAMRALSRRASPSVVHAVSADDDGVAPERSGQRGYRRQVFVPGGPTRSEPATRRPVPAAMEAVMYPERVERSDMSAARRQMMARRRRTLLTMGAGFLVGIVLVLAMGSTLAWAFLAVFTVGLGGYLSFLRNQALHDRERRQARMRRRVVRPDAGYDATTPAADEYEQEFVTVEAVNVVRIDDDDVSLHGMADTVDLTGLYSEEQFDDRPMRRAV